MVAAGIANRRTIGTLAHDLRELEKEFGSAVIYGWSMEPTWTYYGDLHAPLRLNHERAIARAKAGLPLVTVIMKSDLPLLQGSVATPIEILEERREILKHRTEELLLVYLNPHEPAASDAWAKRRQQMKRDKEIGTPTNATEQLSDRRDRLPESRPR